MSKGRILKMALDEIVGGVKKVDLGDLTKKVNVGDRVEAVKRMVGDAGEKVVKKADDWGWTGPKSGEISGSEFVKMRDSVDNDVLETLKAEGLDENRMLSGDDMNPDYMTFAAARSQQLADLYDKAAKQLTPKFGKMSLSGVENTMETFAALERAGTPRKLTGKVVRRLGDIGLYVDDNFDAQKVREALRPLSESERDAFFEVLPQAANKLQSTEDLPAMARFIQDTYTGLSPTERETFLSLLPEWADSLDELAGLARTI